MKTKKCERCKHQDWIGLDMKCKKGHKPRFYMPKNPTDKNFGYKRKCEDFSQK